ncbi:metallophosphoesterase, partial [Stenotrophomonas sp.]|uniref:metallophosphoesterase n=1 Tax=Stenotrophomonas sp. TaxID=69392 RepID=UPI002FCC9F58
MAHDIIGDIHGQAGKLKALLKHLGYRERMGAWRHPERSARFVGDLIDRGPGQLETLDIVRRMIDAGSAEAILGNHEFNAIAYATPDPEQPERFLRPRGPHNHDQHRAFLTEVTQDSALHREWVQWFMTLPLWMETDQWRLVHACWHPASMAVLADQLGPRNTLTPELVVAASRPGSAAFVAVEALCKGLEIALPAPVTFTDKQGVVRHRTRVRWWDDTAATYRAAALMGREAAQLPDTPIPDSAIARYDQAKPVFFGHYWFNGTPGVISAKACCVD